MFVHVYLRGHPLPIPEIILLSMNAAILVQKADIDVCYIPKSAWKAASFKLPFIEFVFWFTHMKPVQTKMRLSGKYPTTEMTGCIFFFMCLNFNSNNPPLLRGWDDESLEFLHR